MAAYPLLLCLALQGTLLFGGAPLAAPAYSSSGSALLAAATHRPKILIVGGGTSHDFAKNYREIDQSALRAAGDTVQYTTDYREIPSALKDADVLVQASNQLPGPDAAARRAILDFVDRGHGLVVLHAGAWYNWPDWPEYNAELVGGGTREHDHLGTFEVKVVEPGDPVMRGVPKQFQVTDELYHQQMAAGAGVEVLATAISPLTGKTYPIIWIVQHRPGRIVCITLGHDERTHNSPAYRRILRNAVEWAARQ